MHGMAGVHGWGMPVDSHLETGVTSGPFFAPLSLFGSMKGLPGALVLDSGLGWTSLFSSLCDDYGSDAWLPPRRCVLCLSDVYDFGLGLWSFSFVPSCWGRLPRLLNHALLAPCATVLVLLLHVVHHWGSLRPSPQARPRGLLLDHLLSCPPLVWALP